MASLRQLRSLHARALCFLFYEFVVAFVTYAADPQVNVPELGYVFDESSQTIRPVLGIPGATRLGESLLLGDPVLTKAWISPGSDRAFVAAVDHKLHLIDLRTRNRWVIGDIPGEVVWSPTGSAAALLYAGGRVVILKNVNSTPDTATDTVMDSKMSAVAVADDAAVLLAVRPSIQGTTLAVIRDGTEQAVLSAPGLNHTAFLIGTHDAVATDASEGKLYILRNTAELSLAAQVEPADALAIDANNDRVLLANSARKRVTAVRLSDGSITSVECVCDPGALERVRRNLFRVSPSGQSPMWFFDPDSTDRPFTFVPSLETSQ